MQIGKNDLERADLGIDRTAQIVVEHGEEIGFELTQHFSALEGERAFKYLLALFKA
ncbi:MAG: hypothetical protein AAFY15_04985 [Cyanobacteria bacterium J06648_11]